MGTSIVLNDVVFFNKNLPVVAELVSDGLAAAFRPTLSKESLVDLSGNGVRATIIGNPVFDDGFMSGYFQNGFRIEAAETESVTLMTVCRAGVSMDRGGSASAAPISSRWDTSGAQRGCGISLYLSSLRYTSNAQVYLKSKTDASMLNKYYASGYLISELTSLTDETKTPWMFLATTIDVTTNTVTQFIPKYGIEVVSAISDGDIRGRRITNSSNGQMNRFEICSAAGYSGSLANCDVAEALLFNKSLSRAQIYEQYELSKSFFEKNRAVSI